MALFGKKKPQELYAEAERYVKLVADWLKQPMEPLRPLSASDREEARDIFAIFRDRHPAMFK